MNMSNNAQGDPTKLNEYLVPSSEFSDKLQQEMAARGLTIDDVKKIADTSYEATRRYVRSLSSPSLAVSRLLCEYFGWNFDEIKQMLIRDRERRTHGDVLDLAHGMDPEAQKFSRAFLKLNKHQKANVMETIAQHLINNATKQ